MTALRRAVKKENNMTTKVTFGIKDNSNEIGYFSVSVPNVTDGAGFDVAKNAEGDLALYVAALSLGVINTQNIGVNDVLSKDRATDPYALRETAVTFTMTDSENNLVKASLPAPDLTKFPFAALGQDTTPVPYTGVHADVDIFIQTLEAEAVHPITGNALTVIRLDLVGRSN